MVTSGKQISNHSVKNEDCSRKSGVICEDKHKDNVNKFNKVVDNSSYCARSMFFAIGYSFSEHSICGQKSLPYVVSTDRDGLSAALSLTKV